MCDCVCDMCSFLNHDRPTSLFSIRDRQKVAYEILAITVYGKRKLGQIGIDRLLDEGVYSAAFPLHDVIHSFSQVLVFNRRELCLSCGR